MPQKKKRKRDENGRYVKESTGNTPDEKPGITTKTENTACVQTYTCAIDIQPTARAAAPTKGLLRSKTYLSLGVLALVLVLEAFGVVRLDQVVGVDAADEIVKGLLLASAAFSRNVARGGVKGLW